MPLTFTMKDFSSSMNSHNNHITQIFLQHVLKVSSCRSHYNYKASQCNCTQFVSLLCDFLHICPTVLILHPSHPDIIRKHSFDVHAYADDDQLYISIKPLDAHECQTQIEACIKDIKHWMSSKFLKVIGDIFRHNLSKLEQDIDCRMFNACHCQLRTCRYFLQIRWKIWASSSLKTWHQMSKPLTFPKKKVKIWKYLDPDTTKLLVPSCM